MVVTGFYKLHGVFVTENECNILRKNGWADAEEPLPGEKFLRSAKDPRCTLLQIPHGYEDLKGDDSKWFFGVGEHVYFGPYVEETIDSDQTNYLKYDCVELFNLVNNEMKFKNKPEEWVIPDDCPCCS